MSGCAWSGARRRLRRSSSRTTAGASRRGADASGGQADRADARPRSRQPARAPRRPSAAAARSRASPAAARASSSSVAIAMNREVTNTGDSPARGRVVRCRPWETQPPLGSARRSACRSSRTTRACAPAWPASSTVADRFVCVSQHESGERAIAELPGVRPDVVLMDINLPGMSGVECVRRLKTLAAGRAGRDAHGLRGHRPDLRRARRRRHRLPAQADAAGRAARAASGTSIAAARR